MMNTRVVALVLVVAMVLTGAATIISVVLGE
ncbi:FlaG/FlaF family flagellin (archaellin) [Marmoricola sp. OAE513]